MIGAFARMLGSQDRVLACEQTGDNAYTLRTSAASNEPTESRDHPPEGFVEKIAHEGGDVFFAPLLETLRNVLRSRARPDERSDEKGEADPSISAPEA